MNLKVTSAMVFAAVLAACAAQAQGDATATPDPPQIDAAPAGPPPGMPKPVTLAGRPGAGRGGTLYVEYCAMCHAPGGMGHGLLARRIATPDLERRDNLPAPYVILAARQGIGNMPAIPRGEVSDEELQAIADYLAAGPRGGAR